MQVNKYNIMGLVQIILLSACIDPFQPKIDEVPEMIVINGRITDIEGYQYVEVSKSTPFNEPAYNPVPGCTVTISDEKNNLFTCMENTAGHYQSYISKEYLSTGNRYRLEVSTPDGKLYQSDYETILHCPAIDSIYYEVKTRETDNPDMPTFGIQFYLNTDASGTSTRNFRWDISETWEYHAAYMVSDYYDGQINYSPVIYDTLYYCWKSNSLPDIFTFTTQHLTSGRINHYPLNFVSDKSDRLSVKYSMLVRQYSLSDNAFNYWNTLQSQSQGTGGFYETQPAGIPGNIHCITQPDDVVLGYFTASAVTEKRIFVSSHFDFIIYSPYCERYNLDSESLNTLLENFKRSDYPIFLINLSGIEIGPWDFADQYCFDCRSGGGKLIKPDFWE